MADALALDTNVYIRAFRDPEYLARLKRFRVRVGTRVRFHAVVALELRTGVRDERQHAALEALLAPYASRERVIVPSFEAFAQAGRVLAALALREGIRVGGSGARPSLANDALLASSCREVDATLVTENTRDFVAIQRHLRGFRFREASDLI